MDAVLHALSDGSRRTVLEALSDGPATVSELAVLLPIARPGVSRHLRVLRRGRPRRRAPRSSISSVQPASRDARTSRRVAEQLPILVGVAHGRSAHRNHPRKEEGRHILKKREQTPASPGRCNPLPVRASSAWRAATKPTSTTCGPHSPRRSAWPAGSPRSTETYVSAEHSEQPLRAAGKGLAALTRANLRGACS
jgi:hypothetical protein